MYVGAALSFCAIASRGAQVYTEAFPTNFSGWTDSVANGSGAWFWGAGQLFLGFDLQDSIPFPDQGLLVATNASSGGRFTGNWTTAAVDAVGFDFTASNFPPGGIDVKLVAPGGSTFSRSLVAPPAGATESFYLSAEGLAEGGWLGVPVNSEAAFTALKTNVQKVQITVARGGASNHVFRVDNCFLSRAHRWDGGVGGGGTNWLFSTNWAPDGIPASNSRILFTNAGAATVIGIDSSQASGGVVQVGQMYCVVSNRTFENSATTNDSRLQFNGYGGVFVTAGSNVVVFRNGASRPLELVGNRYRGEFHVAAGGSVIVSNCAISETNGAYRLDKLGPGGLYLGASNRFSGGVLLRSGLLSIGHTHALGTGGLVVHGGLLDLNGSPVSVASLAGTNGVISDSSAGAGVTALTVTQAATTTFGGIFSNGAEKVLQLVKNGTGTLFIAGTNLNTGPTLANRGSLHLDANDAVATNAYSFGELGAGGVLVSTGATFGGFGRVRGSITNNGTVAPGYPTGVLYCAGGYVQATNALITFNVAGTTGATAFAQSWQETTVATNAATNLVTNVVTVSRLYNRMVVDREAQLAGTLRAAFAGGLTPSNGMSFRLLSALALRGSFATNSFATNNLPAPPPGGEWNILYSGGDVILACVTSAPPVVHAAHAIVVEGNSGTTSLQFMVSLSKPATASVTVVFATSNGTAVAGDDYAATNGSVVIPPGGVSAFATVAVNGDAGFEDDETVQIHLLEATNATIGTAQATGTIVNDDSAPSLAVGAVVQAEGDGGESLFAFPVTLSSAAAVPVSVTFATSNGTAVAGGDYAATNGTLTIAAGTATGFIHVAVQGDTTYEPDEGFSISLLGATNGIITNASAAATILNDDAPPALSIGGVTQNEYNGTFVHFVFPVTLSTPSLTPVTVDFATSNGTALAGGDYIATNGTLTIPAGSAGTTITVRVLGDTNSEPNEDFVVALFNVSTNASIETPAATGLILDDDVALYYAFYFYSLQIPDVDQRGYHDDPDGDGYVNLLEFATGGDPTNADAIAALSLAPGTNSTPAMRFTRNTNSADQMTLVVEGTDENSDASPWTGIATNISGLWTGPATVTESGVDSPVEVLVEETGTTNRLLRLRVIPP